MAGAKPPIDYYIIPCQTSEPRQLAEKEKRLEWISGFSGVPGMGVVSKMKAYLFFERQHLCGNTTVSAEDWVHVPVDTGQTVESCFSWLAENLNNSIVGFDARILWHTHFQLLKPLVTSTDSRIALPSNNFIDMIWADKPNRAQESASVHPISVPDPASRLKVIRNWIKSQHSSEVGNASDGPASPQEGPTAVLIVSPPSIAFSLHLEGNPMFQSYLFVGLEMCVLFADFELDDPIRRRLEKIGVTTDKYNGVFDFIKGRTWGGGRVLLSPGTPHAIAYFLASRTTRMYILAPCVVEYLKDLEKSARSSIKDWKQRLELLFDENPKELTAIEKEGLVRNYSFVVRAMSLGSSVEVSPSFEGGEMSADTLFGSPKKRCVTILIWLQNLTLADLTLNQIYELREKEAEDFLEAVQQVLDWTNDPNKLRTLLPSSTIRGVQTLRRRCRRLLSHLAYQSRRFPRSYSLNQGVEKEEKESVHPGGFADIYKGTYKNQPIALKRTRLFHKDLHETQKLLRMFFNEVVVWRQLDHPCIVPFIGLWYEEPNPIPGMISPWMAKGSARRFVQDKRITQNVVHKLLIDVVDGLAYLHSECIFHGDLCGNNILVDEDNHALLCDFGLTSLDSDRVPSIRDPSIHPPRGTIAWMAPELLARINTTPTRYSDIYSFGCVGVELYGGQDSPFTGVSDKEIMENVPNGLCPQNPGDGRFGRPIPPQLWKLFEECWRGSPIERPGAEVALKRLREIANVDMS
ncbi:hypothetical protein JAAARDRAFT_42528 [Jaapia argillacea MUCL 33604]|uniref:Protein kinase domain-containing protein n=1 Tax=Jaapia argillacea MUCL 33604 TaxID=933084 RepID=A0A067P5B7_9AGAM|nr:hypothetical protein JAAARDRAFT_42528 [Jaapia argillacea MUCL 33604]